MRNRNWIHNSNIRRTKECRLMSRSNIPQWMKGVRILSMQLSRILNWVPWWEYIKPLADHPTLWMLQVRPFILSLRSPHNTPKRTWVPPDKTKYCSVGKMSSRLVVPKWWVRVMIPIRRSIWHLPPIERYKDFKTKTWSWWDKVPQPDPCDSRNQNLQL